MFKSKQYAVVDQVTQEFLQAFQALAPQLQAREYLPEDPKHVNEDLGLRFIEFGAEGATIYRVIVEQRRGPKDTPPSMCWHWQKRAPHFDSWNTEMNTVFPFYNRILAATFLIAGVRAHLGL